MSTFTTTNVRLPADMLKALKRRALEEGVSVAQLIRASVTEYLLRSNTGNIDYARDSFFSLSQDAGEGPSDGAQNHDRYIYGTAGNQPA